MTLTRKLILSLLLNWLLSQSCASFENGKPGHSAAKPSNLRMMTLKERSANSKSMRKEKRKMTEKEKQRKKSKFKDATLINNAARVRGGTSSPASEGVGRSTKKRRHPTTSNSRMGMITMTMMAAPMLNGPGLQREQRKRKRQRKRQLEKNSQLLQKGKGNSDDAGRVGFGFFGQNNPPREYNPYRDNDRNNERYSDDWRFSDDCLVSKRGKKRYFFGGKSGSSSRSKSKSSSRSGSSWSRSGRSKSKSKSKSRSFSSSSRNGCYEGSARGSGRGRGRGRARRHNRIRKYVQHLDEKVGVYFRERPSDEDLGKTLQWPHHKPNLNQAHKHHHP